MTPITRRRIASLVVFVLFLAGGVYIARVTSILAAYKAKMLCSEVFLAGRDPGDVEHELEVDDLRPLLFITDAVFHATGHAGQFVTVIPSARLVVVRLGLTR